MTRRIFVELALFLLPFVVFLVYRAASRELRIRDRWPLTLLVVIGAALAIIALVAKPLLAPSDKGKCYVAARYESGKNIPAQRVDCKAATAPDQAAPPPTPTPVAPRDVPTSLPGAPPIPGERMKIPDKTPDKPLKDAPPEIPAKPDKGQQAPPPPTPIPITPQRGPT